MNKKFYCLISLLLCVCFIFGEAAALDSWDHYKGPIITKDPDGTTVQTQPVTVEPKNDTPDVPVIPDVPAVVSGLLFDEPSTTSTLSVNSIELNGMDDASTQQILDILSSLKITSQSQKGDTTRGAFAISLMDTDLLSFGFQGGETYFVTSNLFGGNTYMINDEDKFEENLAASIYDLTQQMSSGSGSSTVSLEEIQTAIGTIREAIRNGNVAQTATPSFELEQEVNPTALLMGVQPIMEKFGVDDPTADIAYRYMDYSAQTVYEWPAESELPQPGKSVAAMSGILGREELLAILDQLPIFFEDNPELAEKLNQAMKDGMEKSSPELVEKYGNDFLGGFISELRNAVDTNLGSFAIKFKMDQDENGTPILITLWVGEKPAAGGEEPESGIKVSILLVNDSEQSAYEIDADAFQGVQTMPVLRALLRADHGDDVKVTANAIFGMDPSSIVELALASTSESYLTGTSSSNTDIDFKASDFSAHLSIYKVDKPNLFSDNDTTTELELTVNASGAQVFSISMTSENQTGDPMPQLTAADAIAASGMTKADYDNLAQSIFMQIMMLTMNFS